MPSVSMLRSIVVPAAGVLFAAGAPPRRPPAAPNAGAVACPSPRPVVYIPATGDPALRDTLKSALGRENTIVKLADGVDLDFSGLPAEFFPIYLANCVTLTSVAGAPGGAVAARADRAVPVRGVARAGADSLGWFPRGGVVPDGPEARTPRSPGPVLRFGPHRDGANTFLAVRSFHDGPNNDHVRISGFRLFGPSFGQQTTDEVGIRITRSVDVEVANMEIAGWASVGVAVEDDSLPEPLDGGGSPDGRIRHFDEVRIHGNYIHHNQHPNRDGHAAGYGVESNVGAWMRVSRNVFDDNRHSIAASGRTGGYVAERNLVLKGGGIHDTFFNAFTHAFDVHGTGCWWSDNLCGDAGTEFLYDANAFQYRKDNAIKIRGRPRRDATITRNVFPHPGLEADRGDDAVNLQTTANVTLGPGNVVGVDTFGEYGTCDFDGDRVDDLFLATGRTWWFSSMGEFPWSFLAARDERRAAVRLGYFDADLRCDVLTESDGRWVVASGGTGEWTSIGAFGVPLSEVAFGQFDPGVRDHRPGATRRTTHAFRRAPDGQWYVTPLAAVNWQPVQSSGFPMQALRFGDFTGDGVTDVLAVVGGRWSISESARSPWRRLNAFNGDAVDQLLIANMDADDNVDDLLRVDRKVTSLGSGPNPPRRVELTVWRSRNGAERWAVWQRGTWVVPATPNVVLPAWAFAARFGVAPGGGTMLIGPDRHGYFFSDAERARGASPAWTSTVAY